MIPFLTYRETDTEGRLCYYILQKTFPYYTGIISLGRLEKSLASSPVSGYNLYVNFNGTIMGDIIPSYKDVLKEISVSVEAMAQWFYINRVLADQKKYAKFKIPT